jgi:phospholipid/cholesterol/gamma-HCH transport system substrate-binding protein
LGKTVKNLNVGESGWIMKGLEAGNGTMGKLLNDDALITTFQNFKELELLLQDVRLHPTRYVNVSLWKERKTI